MEHNRQRVRTLTLWAGAFALGIAASGVALAAPVGTGALYVECGTVNGLCCSRFDFDSTSYDVFGTPVDMGSGVDAATSLNIVISAFTGTSGLFAGTAQSVVPGVFGFDMAGSFLCANSNCTTGQATFVGDISNLSGSFALPAGLTYTLDGSDMVTGSVPAPTIPGCTVGAANVFSGQFGVNAFQSATTPTGMDVTVPTSTTFFDSATGNQVTVAIDATFAQVDSPGQTVVKAFSNASGVVPGNFAAQVNGSCAVDAGISCCIDSDCPSGTCSGCYRAAYADVTTTAAHTGSIEICANYPDADNDGFVDGTPVDETRLRFLHEEAGVFVDRTSLFDPVNNRICAQVASLSFFIVGVRQVAPGECPPLPANGCRGAGKSTFQLTHDAANAGKDKLAWKWLKGAATMASELGDPAAATNYRLCVYAGAASESIALPAGASWQALGSSGYKFNQPSGSPDGASKALLKSGAAGKSKVLVKGKGTLLPDTLAPPLSLPVTVQLINDSNGVCYTAEYSTPLTNAGGQFKAKTP